MDVATDKTDRVTQWSIQQVAKVAGTTSRTLRHYADLGLLTPSRIGHGGLRYYDQDCLVRLQRILLLRELGLGLSAIGEVLSGQRDTTAALHIHLELLEQEKARIERQIASVRTTLHKTEGGEQLMAEEMFSGFDHTRYQDEVVQRWGRQAYDRSDRWWRGMSEADKRAHGQQHEQIAADYGRARSGGSAPDSDLVQEIAARHVRWLSGPVEVTGEYVANIGELYVSDDRFRANYDKYGAGTAEYVRDALRTYAERSM